ncbi:SRPBCC family protein [Rhodococcus pyridinivorans]|uniref:SRPBCC family protein n=1 Tax=Rhodococcus pyridinivorans TaxID=103816 RepID=UPI0022832FA8|nr:SRPBCC family protein [Rhodococcus pyridinivorans]WAL49541.1 SRPBCC family protein [Rhodococcus pyridinivorans]
MPLDQADRSRGRHAATGRRVGQNGQRFTGAALVALDEHSTKLMYEFVGANPFNVRRYVATVRVSPVTDTGGSFVEWWAEFDADADAEADLVALFSNGVFADGIAGLRSHLEFGDRQSG